MVANTVAIVVGVGMIINKIEECMGQVGAIISKVVISTDLAEVMVEVEGLVDVKVWEKIEEEEDLGDMIKTGTKARLGMADLVAVAIVLLADLVDLPGFHLLRLMETSRGPYMVEVAIDKAAINVDESRDSVRLN